MPPPTPRVVLFSGLGCGAGLLARQTDGSLPFPVEVPPWLDPFDDEPLEAYARRMASSVGAGNADAASDLHGRRDRLGDHATGASNPSGPLGTDAHADAPADVHLGTHAETQPGARSNANPSAPSRAAPLVLGGLSLGAFVALEAARVLRPAAVVMIAGGWSGRQVAGPVRALGEVAGRLPVPAIRAALHGASAALWTVGITRPIDRHLLMRVLPHGDPRHWRWGALATLRWAYRGPPPSCPVYHIHGGDDLILPVGKQTPRPAVVVPGAGHLVNVTSPAVVNAWLAGWVNDAVARTHQDERDPIARPI